MLSLPKTKWLWFSFLLALVVSSNVLIYRLDMMQPLPKEVALGTLFDFILVVPLITYFFIIRKRYSLKYLLPVVLAGYGCAWLIMPQGLLSSYSFVKYILFACEGAFLLIEFYLGFKLITKFPAIIKKFRTNLTEIPTFQHRLEQTLSYHFKSSRVLDIIASDMTMFYYSLFSWSKTSIPILQNRQIFTYYKKTSTVAFYLMLIHALVLESIGFHFLLHSWSPIFSIITLILNGYTVLVLLAQLQAIRLCPFMITNQHLYLQVGIMKQLTVSLQDIKSIHYFTGPEKQSKDEKKFIFDAVLTDFAKEKPTLEIEFNTPQEVKLMYGFKRKITKAHLRPDESQRFYDALTTKLNEGNE
ncbi:hypothetical protein [Bacillus sp. 03113]|uniref:hypothetical protein n=1 Tax=Bacillus sp. 03113 TaxID=2578211 RepID=UPI001141565A|nr:hypothetical protein [Bacillus sp. 03113]